MRKRISALDLYLDDLEQVFEQTLLLTRLQQRDEVVSLTGFDLQQTVTDIVSKYQQDNQTTFSVDCELQQKAYGNEGLPRLALSNLLSNATRHTNSAVAVRVSNESDNICLTVEDDGDGIPIEFRDQLFVPFSRIDDSRSRESGGIGLGLSLVGLIARQHDGSVIYFTSQPGGAGFEFCWPGLTGPKKSRI